MRPIHGLWVVLAIAAALVVGLLLVGRQPLGSGVAPALPAESLAPPREEPRPAAELADVGPDGAAAARAAAPLTTTVGHVRPDPQPAAAGTGFRLRGRIVSAAGAPLAGATVHAAPSGGFLDVPLDELEPERMAFVRRVTATTGADGRFEVELAARAALRFAARAAGFAPHDAEVAISGAEHDLGDVVLAPGVVLEGRVVDSRGHGVAGAELRRLSAEDGAFVPIGRAFGVGGAKVATTDEQGLFRIDELAAGPWRVLVAHEDHPDRVEEGETERAGTVVADLVIALEDGDEIHGRIVGAPEGALANVVVRAQPGSGEGSDLAVIGRRAAGSGAAGPGPRSARVAPDGGFVVRGCKPGTSYRLVGREGERTFATRTRTASAQARAGDRGVQLLYQPAPALVFQAVDAETGQPIEALDVQAGSRFQMPLLDDSGRPLRRFPEGRVRHENLPGRERGPDAASAPLELLVESVGYRPYRRSGIKMIEGQDTDLGVIRLERAPLVEVTVLDGANGEPVAGARVTLEEQREDDALPMRFQMRMLGTGEDDAPIVGAGAAQRARTDASGRAKVTSLPGQRARVVVRAQGYATFRGELLTLPVGEDVATTARLVAGASVAVEVVDTQGAPVAGAVVEHEEPGEPLAMPVGGDGEPRTDAQGLVAFENLEPGLHRFRLAAAGARGGPVRMTGRAWRGGRADAGEERPWSEITLADRAQETLRLVAPVKGRLAGKVEQGGEALANATVTVSEPSEGPRMPFGGGTESKTNAKGRYAVEDLEVGTKQVRVAHPSRAMAWEGEVEIREGENELDLDLPLASIEGQVVGADGKPLAGARVLAERARGGGSRGRAVARFLAVTADGDGDENAALSTGVAGSEPVVTDAEGRYVLRGVAPDVDLVVRASGKDLQPGESKVLRVTADETRRGVDLALETGGTIEVTVVRADGRPGGTCLVTARFEAAGGEASVEPKTVLTNSSGVVRLPGMKPGAWSVEVRPIGFGAQEPAPPPAQSVEVVVGKAATARFDLP